MTESTTPIQFPKRARPLLWLTGLLSVLLAFPAMAQEIALDEIRVEEGEQEAVVDYVPWSGSWWDFSAGRLAQGYHSDDNFTYDSDAEQFSEVAIADVNSLAPLRKYDLYIERKEGTNPKSALLELQGDEAKDFQHHIHGARKQDLDDRGVSYSWWGHCNGWAAAAIMEREPVGPITAEGIRFEVGDLKGLLTETYWGVDSDFTGRRYNKPSEEMRAKITRGQELLDALGTDDEADLPEYITWYEDVFSTTIDDAVKANLKAENFRPSLERARDWAKENWEDAYADLAPHVFHQLLVTQIKNKRSALVFDTSADEEVWNFPAYAYRTKLTKVEDLADGGFKFEVETTVSYAHDGVSESILGVNELPIDYTYTLTTDSEGRPTGGEWTGGSVDEHPDFAWIPTYNTPGEDRGENPNLLYGKLQGILALENSYGPRRLELATVDRDGGVVRQSERIPTHQTSTWTDPVSVDSPVTLRVRRDAAFGIVRVRYTEVDVNAGWDITTVERGEAPLLGEVSQSAQNAELEGSFALSPGPHFIVANGYDASGRLVASSELALDVGGQTSPSISDDDYEENDDQGSATALTAGTYADLWIRDDDWFKVTVPAGGTLRATIRFSHSAGDLDMAIEGVGNSAGTDDQEQVEGTNLNAGDYYVRVFGYSGAQAEYTLELVVEAGNPTQPGPTPDPTPTPGEDSFEENDSRTTAALLTPGIHSIQVNDDDWFAVELAAGESATLTLRFSNAAGDIDLRAVNPQGGELGNSTTTSDEEQVRVQATSAGRYAFRVYGYNNATNSVELELSVSSTQPTPTPTTDDALEGSGNNTRADATPLSRGRHENLRVAGNDDWYAVELQPNETLTFEVGFSHSSGDIDLELHDASGNRIGNSAGTGNTETISHTAGAQPTTVYLRVFGYQGARNSYVLETR
ncbi:MAG: pre-peptidase C-terminal domain-containing protein [Planctomycetes bacterium]|nr:pre-peptidase C-terminal domain-containing protein [Planctomycetota bacterium]